MKRDKDWKVWDDFQKELAPLQRQYAKAAVKLAKKRFGFKGLKPPGSDGRTDVD